MVRRSSSETPSEPSFDCSSERTWPSTDHDTRSNNHVLGSSLDVIAAIRTLAIKVRISWCPKFTFTCQTNNVPLYSGIWTMYWIFSEYPAPLWTPWSRENCFTHGEQPSTCFTKQTTSAKWVSPFFLFDLVIRTFVSLLGYFWHRQTRSMGPSLLGQLRKDLVEI